MPDTPTEWACSQSHEKTSPRFWVLLGLVLALAALVRFWNLSADPSPFNGVGPVVDEGFWTHEARLAALGIPHQDDLVHAKAAGPLSYAFFRASFALGGVSYTTARLPSAVAGLLLVGVVAWFAFTVWGPRQALTAAALMALADAAVIFSRLGLVEMPMTLFLSLALVLLIHPHYRMPLLAGLFAALAFLVKITSAYYFPGLLVAFCLSAPRKVWVSALIRFGLGFVPVPLVWLSLFWLPHAEQYLAMLKAASESLHRPLVGMTGLKVVVHAALFNHFMGQPSIALLVPVVLYLAADWTVWRSKTPVRALLAYAGTFWGIFTFSGDPVARRCIPLVTPFVLLTCWALAKDQPSRNWLRSIVVLMGAGCASRAAWKGSIARSFGVDTTGHLLAFIALGLAMVALMLLLHGHLEKSSVRRWVLRGWALVFVLPAFAGLFKPTFTLRDAARALANTAGSGFVTGIYAHSFALEGHFYPVYYAPNLRGLELLNKNFDWTRVTFQLWQQSQTEMSDERRLGLGIAKSVEKLMTYKILPYLFGDWRYILELYRLHHDPDQQPVGKQSFK